MKSNKRKCYPEILNHCYQNTVDGGLIFYSVSDYLVFYTIASVVASRSPVRVVKMCLMFDHIHFSIISPSKTALCDYMRDCTSWYAKEFNELTGRKGRLFRHSFGSVPVVGDKKARSNLIYVDNNPVERKLVERAEEYRWNFLAYTVSDNPFSEPLVIRRARYSLQRAISEIKRSYGLGYPLNYSQLRRLFARLDRSESEQLTDYILTTYRFIDYEYALRCFGDYETMILADHSTTGSEHNLNELFVGKTDVHYKTMIQLVMRSGPFKDVHDVLKLSVDEKHEWLLFLMKHTEAPPEQIGKFLHLPLIKR